MLYEKTDKKKKLSIFCVKMVPLPTVTPAVPFKDSSDVEALRKAMKGMGTDEMVIINILAHRTYYQREIIKETYNQTYKRNLLDDLKSELSNDFENVIMALMTPMSLYLAQALHKALHGNHINTIIEIICTRDKPSIEKIKKCYMDEHETELTADLNKLSSVKIRKFLIAMITEDRSDVTDDLQIAKYLSQKLFDSGRGKTDISIEDETMQILTKFSFPLLRQVFRDYFNVHDNEFQNVIDSNFPDELKSVLKIVYESITSPPVFFAKELNNAIIGLGTDDSKLIRLVVSRCEIDMENIKEEYEKLYNESLEKAIKGDTSGDYRMALLALIEN